MAQIANTEADRTAAVTARRETFPHSTADVTPDLSNKTQNTMLYLVEKTAAPAKNMVGPSVSDDAKRGLLLPTTQAALEMVKVGGAVVGFWFQRGIEQLAHNSLSLNEACGGSGLARGAGNPRILSPRRPLAAERGNVRLCGRGPQNSGAFA